MRLIADRENDNAALVAWDEPTYRLNVAAEARLGAVNIWARFRVEGLERGRELTLQLEGIDPVAGFVPLYVSWDDGRTWQRTETAESPYKLTVQGESLEVSRNLPFGHDDLLAWCAAVAREVDGRRTRVESLCRSRQGRDVPMLVSEPADADAPLVWVHARSHAFESHSSRVAAALAHWLLGAEGEPLRRQAMVCITPMIDVDAVAMGSAGKNRSPHDPNRDFVQEHYPQVAAIKQRLAALTRQRRLAVFIDLHSPWFYNRCEWYVAPDEREHLSPLVDTYMQVLERIEARNSWHNELVDYTRQNVQRDPRYQGASRWARQAFPEALSTTMEVAHDRDADDRSMTPQGLDDFARALGLTFTELVEAGASRV